jgi:hypothetical protein
MSGKTAKKLRQLHRRDFNTKMEGVIGDIQSQMRQIVRPAPRFFPKRLWRRLGKVFLNI